MQRVCKECGETKPLDDFPKYKANGKSGRRHKCKLCWNAQWTPVIIEHNKRYYHENKNGYRDRQKSRTLQQKRRRPKDHQRRNRKYEKLHPERAAAKRAVMIAVRSGNIIPQPCEVCGKSSAQAHHDDYSKPLEVLWLCRFHHGERHRLINRYGDPSEWPEDLRIREMPLGVAGT